MRKLAARFEQELYDLIDQAPIRDSVRAETAKEWAKQDVHAVIVKIRGLWQRVL